MRMLEDSFVAGTSTHFGALGFTGNLDGTTVKRVLFDSNRSFGYGTVFYAVPGLTTGTVYVESSTFFDNDAGLIGAVTDFGGNGATMLFAYSSFLGNDSHVTIDPNVQPAFNGPVILDHSVFDGVDVMSFPNTCTSLGGNVVRARALGDCASALTSDGTSVMFVPQDAAVLAPSLADLGGRYRSLAPTSSAEGLGADGTCPPDQRGFIRPATCASREPAMSRP